MEEVMTRTDEDPIQSIWKSQPIVPVLMTPEKMRARAAQFESATKKRNRVDYLSFALVAIMAGIGALIVEGVLVRVGALLMALWAVVGLYGVRRFHQLTVQRSTESSPSSCAAWYQQNLERQRDVALSRAWGIALVVPGFVLMLIGYAVDRTPWVFSAILGGVGLFCFVVAVIHGRILAGKWQDEIHSRQDMTSDGQGHSE
jgi:hypothetical protein